MSNECEFNLIRRIMVIIFFILQYFLLCIVQASRWSGSRRCLVLFNERDECGWLGISKGECEQQGCCWRPAPSTRNGVKWCFHSKDSTPAYSITSHTEEEMADIYQLKYSRPDVDSHSPVDLQMAVRHQQDILHLQIASSHHRPVPSQLYDSIPGYEMPRVDWNIPQETSDLLINIETSPFQFQVMRRSDKSIIFSTSARDEASMFGEDPFDSIIMKNHFVQIGTELPPDNYIYGLGERMGTFRKVPGRMAFNARDTPAEEDKNSYGSHPFYLEMRPGGLAHGVVRNHTPSPINWSS